MERSRQNNKRKSAIGDEGIDTKKGKKDNGQQGKGKVKGKNVKRQDEDDQLGGLVSSFTSSSSRVIEPVKPVENVSTDEGTTLYHERKPRRKLHNMLIHDEDKFESVLNFHKKTFWNRRDFGGDNECWMKGHTFMPLKKLPLYADIDNGNANLTLNCSTCEKRRCRDVCVECTMLMLHSVAVCSHCKPSHVNIFPKGKFESTE